MIIPLVWRKASAHRETGNSSPHPREQRPPSALLLRTSRDCVETCGYSKPPSDVPTIPAKRSVRLAITIEPERQHDNPMTADPSNLIQVRALKSGFVGTRGQKQTWRIEGDMDIDRANCIQSISLKTASTGGSITQILHIHTPWTR